MGSEFAWKLTNECYTFVVFEDYFDLILRYASSASTRLQAAVKQAMPTAFPALSIALEIILKRISCCKTIKKMKHSLEKTGIILNLKILETFFYNNNNL